VAKAHEIAIAADAKQFDQGIRSGVVKPLEQAEKALEQLADAADDAGRDGSRGIDRLEDALKDAQRQAKKTEDAVDDIGDGGKASMGKWSEGAKEVSQEIGQNLGETVSSIRGNLSDLGQVGQDTLGGLAATLAGGGPAGIVGAAGLAAGAIGLGLVTAELQKQQEEADRMRERLGAAYQGAAEDGRKFLDVQTIIADGMDLIFNPERAEEYKRVLDDATQLGLDRATVIAANTGDLEAQAAVQEQINRLLEDSNSYELTGTTNKKTLKNDVADIRDRWQEVVKTTQEYADKASVANGYTSTMLLGLIDSAGTAKEEVDDLGNKLVTFQTENGEMQVFIDAQTGQATENLDRFRGDADSVINDVNAKEVTLKARATIDQAQRDLDGFVTRNSGKEIKIKGRIVTDGSWQ
jgi:hypothetical protein